MCEPQMEAQPFRSRAFIAPACLVVALASWQLGALIHGVALIFFLPLPIVLATLRNRWWLPTLCAVVGYAGGKLELADALAGLVSANVAGELISRDLAFALVYVAGVVVARFSPSRYYGWLAIALLPLAVVLDLTTEDHLVRRSNALTWACNAGAVVVFDRFEIVVLRRDSREAGLMPCANTTLTQREAFNESSFEKPVENTQEKSCTKALVMRKMSDFPLSSFAPTHRVEAQWICHEGLN